jgi:hypothetical protein
VSQYPPGLIAIIKRIINLYKYFLKGDFIMKSLFKLVIFALALAAIALSVIAIVHRCKSAICECDDDLDFEELMS